MATRYVVSKDLAEHESQRSLRPISLASFGLRKLERITICTAESLPRTPRAPLRFYSENRSFDVEHTPEHAALTASTG
jgi:hypothetical protein